MRFRLKPGMMYAILNWFRSFARQIKASNIILFRTSATVEPVTSLELEKGCSGIQRRKVCPVMSVLITFAILTGHLIPPTMICSSESAINVLRAWSTSVFCFRSVFIVFECCYNHLLWPSIAMRYCFLIHCLVGYVIMVIFFIKRQGIATSLLRLEKLYSNLYACEKVRNRLIIVFMCVWSLGLILMLILGQYFFFYQYYYLYSHLITTSSPSIAGNLPVVSYSTVVLTSVHLSYNFASATLYVTILVCCHSYLLSAQLLGKLGKVMRNVDETCLMNSSAASKYLRYFNSIFRSMQMVDKTLNLCVLGVYMAIMDGFYIVLGMVLSGEESFQQAAVALIEGLICVDSLVMLFTLSLFGDAISRAHERLQYDLVEVSDLVLRRSSTRVIHMFSLLFANIRTVDVRATGMGYFVVTRKIIPSVLGAIFTYGVVIHQMGATTHLQNMQQ